jgi:hypothetical protein
VVVKSLSLIILPQRFSICHLSPDEPIPTFLSRCPFFSITRTSDELSIVVNEEMVPADWKAEIGWRCLKVIGPLNFDLTGSLASLSMPLCKAGISIFVISTYDTDYILVKEDSLEKATRILLKTGHRVR